jgi:glutamine cyclotransferase
MITAYIQYPIGDEVYRNLLFVCSKRGYKVKNLDKQEGIIEAMKASFFKGNRILRMQVQARETTGVKIEVSVMRKNIADQKAEQRITDTIYQYF